MQAEGTGRFRFGEFEMDLRARTLHHQGRETALRSKSFDVLACLVCNAGSLVTKDELIETVWPGIVATDESLARCISDARSVLRDSEKAVIRTVPGRGYQFTAEVAAADETGAPAPAARPSGAGPARRAVPWIVAAALIAVTGAVFWLDSGEETAPALVRPAIAVLPFRNSNDDARVEPFVVGLTSDLNTALARIPDMLVIAENSTRQYEGTDVDIRQVAAALGVSHVLTGSVQRADDRLRVFVQLSDGKSGSATWASRYDRDLSNFLGLQDDIVKNVLIGLQIELTQGETAGISGRGTDNLDAWLSYVEGYDQGFKFKRETNLQARGLFAAASELDPAWAAPVSGQAWTYREALRRGWSDDAEADREKWYSLAQKCLQLDARFSGCYIQLGNYFIENDRVDEGLALREKALQLAPNDISALSGLAWQLILVGQVERGLELLQRAKLVSPIHPPWLIATEAYGYQAVGRFDKAIEGYRYALAHSDFPDLHARLAAVYAESGDLDNAREQARLFIEKRPSRGISDLTRIMSIQDPERTRQYAGLLRQAGIPD